MKYVLKKLIKFKIIIWKGTILSRTKKILAPLLRKLGLYTIIGKLYKNLFEKRRKG